MNIRLRLAFVVMAAAFAEPCWGQSSLGPRMITVQGVAIRVWTAGLDRRIAGQPVIALEAGSGADLETWKPVFADLTALGPVIAYDRLGLGQSAADSKTPTLARNVETLHDVLSCSRRCATTSLRREGGDSLKAFPSA